MLTLSGLTWLGWLLQKLKATAEAVLGPHQKGIVFSISARSDCS